MKGWVRFFSDYSNNDWGWKIFALRTLESSEPDLGKDFWIVESDHPYHPNEDSFQHVEIPNAKELEVFFAPQTETESDYDYVTLYKDSTHTEYWGEEKYSGGQDGSSKNFPTSRNPLVIQRNSFDVHFRSHNR